MAIATKSQDIYTVTVGNRAGSVIDKFNVIAPSASASCLEIEKGLPSYDPGTIILSVTFSTSNIVEVPAGVPVGISAE